MKNLFLLLSVLLSFTACESEATKENVNEKPAINVPTVVMDSFQQTYPNGSKSDWSLRDNGWYQVAFENNGVPHRTGFHPSGRWMETQSNMPISDLPAIVKTTIKEQYQGYEIIGAKQVTHHKKGLVYDVDFKNTKEKMNVEFDKDGEAINMKKSKL